MRTEFFSLLESYSELKREWRYTRALKLGLLKSDEYVSLSYEEIDKLIEERLKQ